jgi:hypothetical protein
MLVTHYLFSIWFGFKIYILNKTNKLLEKKDKERSKFMIELQSDLGLLGTIFGFIIILQLGFNSLDVANIASLQQALTIMSSGLGTALLTTAVGLTSRILLIIQYNILQKNI